MLKTKWSQWYKNPTLFSIVTIQC